MTDKESILVRHFKLGIFVTMVLPAILIIGIFASLIIFEVIQFPTPPQQECIASHIGTIKQQNANGKITYNEPRKICDVTQINAERDGEKRIIGYKYSYEIRQAYGKSFQIIKPSCDDENFDDTAVFDNTTMNFICTDGTIAREYNSIAN